MARQLVYVSDPVCPCVRMTGIKTDLQCQHKLVSSLLTKNNPLYILKTLDPKRPIREADITRTVVNLRHASLIGGNRRSQPPAACRSSPCAGPRREVEAEN
jgi:hypothetical protein